MIYKPANIMKKMVVLGLVMGMYSDALSQPWAELLREKAYLFEENPGIGMIKRQQLAFARNEAPAISHAVIKNIPIDEWGGEVVDMTSLHNARVTMMPNPTKPFESDACNSGLPSASKMRETIYNTLVEMLDDLDYFSKHFGYEPGQISIKVFEGLRNLKTQEMLFNNKKAEIMAANSDMTDEQAETETSKWVSPVKNNVPVHSTGAAVDIRLWNEKTQDFLDLGKFGVIWGANPSSPTYSEDITDIQKRNRLYFLMAATQAGFTNYVYEYWHVSWGDRYATYWQESNEQTRHAIYGPLE